MQPLGKPDQEAGRTTAKLAPLSLDELLDCCEVAVPDPRQSEGEEVTEEVYHMYLTSKRDGRLSLEDRACQRLKWDRRTKSLDFAIMQQILVVANDWPDVVRYDCCHGTFHVHRFFRRRPESRTEIGDLSDLDRNYDIAAEAVVEGWEENRRRYLDG